MFFLNTTIVNFNKNQILVLWVFFLGMQAAGWIEIWHHYQVNHLKKPFAAQVVLLLPARVIVIRVAKLLNLPGEHRAADTWAYQEKTLICQENYLEITPTTPSTFHQRQTTSLWTHRWQQKLRSNMSLIHCSLEDSTA